MFVGAWSLAARSAVQILDEGERAAFRSLVPAGARELASGRLWLCAEAQEVFEDAECALAATGFVVPGGIDALCAVADREFDWDARAPAGHFALLRAHIRAGALELVRSPDGGERLYYARVGELLLFATSIRPLLLLKCIGRRLDRDRLHDVLLTGRVVFGDGTLVEGVSEVRPGHVLTVDDNVRPQRCYVAHRLRSPDGSPEQLAREFRDTLTRSVEHAVGRERPIHVALSGGIDSSAIAAAAVDVAGANQVEAITYEFDDPDHPPETSYAEQVCLRLGIREHQVLKIDRDAFLACVPEMVGRAECPVHWPKAFMLPAVRTMRDRGITQFLSGFGIGSHMGWLEELARVLPAIPGRRLALRYWRKIRFDDAFGYLRLARLHPGLEPPHPRLYYPLLVLLRDAGILRDYRPFFPEEMSPLLGRTPDVRRLEPFLRGLPLAERLQRHAFSHLIGCIDVTRPEKALREGAGVQRVSPAHFADCLPYAFFPPHPAPRIWRDARRQRPGKHLLQLAYRGILPDTVLFRVKDWSDAVVSPAWLQQARAVMLDMLPAFPADLDRFGPGLADAVRSWEPAALQASGLAFALWHRLFLEDSQSIWST